MRKDWEKDGGATNYQNIKEDRAAPIGAVKGSDGTIKTSPQEIVEEIAGAWNKHFNKNRKVDVQRFMNEYGQYIPKVESTPLPPLEASRFANKFRSMKSKRAVAADGWRIKELRDLPDSLIRIGAQLVSEVEQEGGRWPEVNTIGIITCILKGESLEEKEMHDDPEDIVAADGDATRPITNTSPWLSAYESIRY
jgi:hypothetical protein